MSLTCAQRAAVSSGTNSVFGSRTNTRTITVGTGGAFGYVPSASGVLGSTPANTVVNVVEIFQGFFQSFGAMMALMAVLAWWAVMRGVSRRHQGGCLVQFVFGVMLINVLPLATFLTALFSANS